MINEIDYLFNEYHIQEMCSDYIFSKFEENDNWQSSKNDLEYLAREVWFMLGKPSGVDEQIWLLTEKNLKQVEERIHQGWFGHKHGNW